MLTNGNSAWRLSLPLRVTLVPLMSKCLSCRSSPNCEMPSSEIPVRMSESSVRSLACAMYCKPVSVIRLRATPKQLSRVKSLRHFKSLSCNDVCSTVKSRIEADWLNAYVVAQHPEKDTLREKWMTAKDRWSARAGWNLTASRINKGNAADLDLPTLLDRIEKELPKAKPEVQWLMNNTLAAIGIHAPKLR